MSCPFLQALPLFWAPSWRWVQTSGCWPGLDALDLALPALALHEVVESQAAIGSEVTPGACAVAGFSIWP